MSKESKKTKLTLTVRQDIIEEAKKKAKETGVSVSKLFELVIKDQIAMETEKALKKQKIADFLKQYENQDPAKALPESDKELWHQQLDEKYG